MIACTPAKHWMESHQCVMALGKLTCKTKQSSIFRTTLDNWSLVHQLIQFKKGFLLFVIQAICPHWLRAATALVLVSTCHVLPWSWNNNCFLLASGTSFQVSTWWIKLGQHMPNCSSKEVGRWVHLDWSKWLDHLKTNQYCITNNNQKCRLPLLELIELCSN